MEMAALRQALTQTPQATQIFLSGTAVFFIVSSFLAYTTGQILAVSGGFGLATPVYGDIVTSTTKR